MIKKIILVLVMFNLSFLLANDEIFSEDEVNESFKGMFGPGLPKNIFYPGDKIADFKDSSLYYSGQEKNQADKTLLLTLLTSRGPVLIKFPDPDVIQVKYLKLKILNFDNTELSLEKLGRSYRRRHDWDEF